MLWLSVDSAAPPGGITSAGLCRLLRESSVSVLLMDIRSRDDFNTSHIKTSDCINVPVDCIHLGSVLSLVDVEVRSGQVDTLKLVLADNSSLC